jgi:rRNA-processing protein FCF1
VFGAGTWENMVTQQRSCRICETVEDVVGISYEFTIEQPVTRELDKLFLDVDGNRSRPKHSVMSRDVLSTLVQ